MEAIDIDFKDCLLSEENTDNIEKWIRYSACKEYSDADQVIKKCGLFRQLGWPDDYLDCIFSFKSYFNGFLRGYLKYIHDAELDYKPILEHYDDWLGEITMSSILEGDYGLSEEEVRVFRDRLNSFAKLTNTIGNYMPCPDNEYNAFKGFRFQDRIDLLYAAVNSEKGVTIAVGKKKYYREWFSRKQKSYYIEDMIKDLGYFCPKKGIVLYMETAEDIRNYSEYMSKVNKLIKNRQACIIRHCNNNESVVR